MTRPGEPSPPEAADLFEAAPCGYVVADATGVIIAANAEAHRMTATTPGSLVGRPFASLLSVGGRIYLETHVLPVLEHDREIREVSVDLARADGTRVPVLVNASLTPGPDGTLRVVLLETRDRHRYEQDLLDATRAAELARNDATALAQTLQETLIPPAPPSVPHLDIAATYRPAGDGSTVGGDFYDIFQLGPSRWAVALGDVSGKGTSAAAVTSFVRYTIRALTVQHTDPGVVLHHLDRALQEHRTEHYCTVALAYLVESRGRWVVTLSLGGHPPPLLRSPAGAVRELGRYGSAVGLVSDARFHTVEHELGDDLLVLYTDGVTEARSLQGLYGEERLASLVSSAPHDPHAVTHTIAEAVLAYQADRAADDIAVVSLARTS